MGHSKEYSLWHADYTVVLAILQKNYSILWKSLLQWHQLNKAKNEFYDNLLETTRYRHKIWTNRLNYLDVHKPGAVDINRKYTIVLLQ